MSYFVSSLLRIFFLSALSAESFFHRGKLTWKAQKLRKLKEMWKIELDEFFSSSSDTRILRLLNPNESSVAYKRRRIREIISSLDSYILYSEACEAVIGN